MISVIHHESSKGMGQFEDESLTTHCQDKEIDVQCRASNLNLA